MPGRHVDDQSLQSPIGNTLKSVCHDCMVFAGNKPGPHLRDEVQEVLPATLNPIQLQKLIDLVSFIRRDRISHLQVTNDLISGQKTHRDAISRTDLSTTLMEWNLCGLVVRNPSVCNRCTIRWIFALDFIPSPLAMTSYDGAIPCMRIYALMKSKTSCLRGVIL